MTHIRWSTIFCKKYLTCAYIYEKLYLVNDMTWHIKYSLARVKLAHFYPNWKLHLYVFKILTQIEKFYCCSHMGVMPVILLLSHSLSFSCATTHGTRLLPRVLDKRQAHLIRLHPAEFLAWQGYGISLKSLRWFNLRRLTVKFAAT